ncbi:MAG: nucleoside 2-deoxyribosyltransferase [Lentisphaeria bacterium]|nr:nucleoside 2-deoxyribosyltransferase [Lentisphaeria bacterium]
MKRPLKIYFAGDLFDARTLGGNLLLARAIERVSAGRYRVMLPQDGESENALRTSRNIRDADFKLLFSCDIIVANFDGSDLDSGTVVEFCFAKMLDIPAVLIRTDFRKAGDGDLPDGEPWNLMCSHYPRTEVLNLNAMEYYHRFKNEDTALFLNRFYNTIAQEVCSKLDKVTAVPSWLKTADLLSAYLTAQKAIGAEIFSGKDLQKLLEEKTGSIYSQC